MSPFNYKGSVQKMIKFVNELINNKNEKVCLFSLLDFMK